MKRVLAPFLVITLILVSLLSTTSFVVPVQAQDEFSVWTDKSVYSVGETVIIQVSPTPAFGVSYWLIIYRPDGSQERIDLTPGQDTIPIAAGPQIGQYRVELWTQVVAPDTTPQLSAYCTYGVLGGVAVSLYSETADGKQNVGTITLDGKTYNLPAQVSVNPNALCLCLHSVTANPPDGYTFDHWEFGGGVSALEGVNQPTTGILVEGDGYAKAWFKVKPDVMYRGDVIEIFPPDYAVVVEEVLQDPTHTLKKTDRTWISVYDAGQVIGNIQAGFCAEVYGELYSASPGPNGYQVNVYQSYHYIKEIPCVGVVVNLFSVTTDGKTNLGSTTFDGREYGLPAQVTVTPNQQYSVTANPPSGYRFDHWETGNGVTGIGDSYAQSTWVYVQSPGHVKTWFKPWPQVDVWTDKGGQGPNVPDGTYQVGDTVRIFYSVNEYVAFASLSFSGPRQFTNNLGSLQAGTFSYDSKTQAGDSGHWSVTFSVCASGDPGLGLCNPAAMAKDVVTFEVVSEGEKCVNSVGDPSKFTCISYLLSSVMTNPDNPSVKGKEVKVHAVIHSKFTVGNQAVLDLVLALLEKAAEVAGVNIVLFLKAAEYSKEVAVFYILLGDMNGEGYNNYPPIFIAAGFPIPKPDINTGSIVIITGKEASGGTLRNYLSIESSEEDQPQDFANLAGLSFQADTGKTVTVAGIVYERDSAHGRNMIRISSGNMVAGLIARPRSAWVRAPDDDVPPGMGAVVTAHGRVVSDSAFEGGGLIDADKVVVHFGQQTRISGHETPPPTLTAVAHSPVALSVYDSGGRHTGPVLDSQGNVMRIAQEIPHSYYSGFGSDAQFVVIAHASDKYVLKLVGLEDGSFTLIATRTTGDKTEYIANVVDQPIAKGQEVSFREQPPTPPWYFLAFAVFIIATVAVVYWQRRLKAAKRASTAPRIVGIESSGPRIIGVEDAGRPRILSVTKKKEE